MAKHTLFELNEFIKRVLTLNLSDSIWISAEIAQVNQSRGHWYLELVEKDELSHQIIAQAQAILWASKHRLIRQKVGKKLKGLLTQGMAVMVLVKVDFSERYGLKLLVEDIDPTYTLGQIALKRQTILEELQMLNLFEKNKRHPLPLVCQRVAVISSKWAAGYQDFLNHILKNEWNYQVQYQLFNAAMQGESVEREIESALNKIKRNPTDFDVVVIIRGGGSKLDLAAFDNLVLSKQIANFPLPVITGIGHEIDESILDLVAHTSLKTPTAVAEFLINRFLEFEGHLNLLQKSLAISAKNKIHKQEFILLKTTQTLKHHTQQLLQQHNQLLTYIEKEVPKLAQNRLKAEKRHLKNIEKTVSFLSPEHSLNRGFSITLHNGKPLDLTTLKKGDVLETITKEGDFKSLFEGKIDT